MSYLVTQRFLESFLPPDAVDFIHTHILHPRAPVQILKRRATATLQSGLDIVSQLLRPYVESLLDYMANNQGITGTALSVLILVITILVLNWIRRIMMWWARLSMRIMFWALVVLLSAWAWERGLMRSARDLVVFGGKAVGYAASLVDVWTSEYERYSAQQQKATTRGRGRGLNR